MAPHLWLWCSEATQKTWLCNETASCNAATWCVPPKHAGSAQASPVVWIRKIHVATKGYKSSFKSMFFHISAYRFTYRLSFSEPEWSSQNMAHPTNRCDNKMIQVGMQGQNRKAKKLVGCPSPWQLCVACVHSVWEDAVFAFLYVFVLWKAIWSEKNVDKLTSWQVMLKRLQMRHVQADIIKVTIWLSATTFGTFEYSSIQIFKSIYSIFMYLSYCSDNFHRTQSCSHRTHGHINPVVASAPF